MPHHLRLFSDVSSKMSMFDQRAKEHQENQMINPFSEWAGAGTRRKLTRDDPEYGRPVEGSKTAERGRQAQVQMIADMVQLCDFIYDCGIRCQDGRAAISFGDLFRLYSSINDKCVGLLMRGRRHKILDFSGEMLFQRRDDDKMIELLLPLNTIRHKYGMPERMGAGEIRTDLLDLLAAEEAQAARSKKQRARSLDLLTATATDKPQSSGDSSQQHQRQQTASAGGSSSSPGLRAHGRSGSGSAAAGAGVWSLNVSVGPTRTVSQPDLNAAVEQASGQRLPLCSTLFGGHDESAAGASNTDSANTTVDPSEMYETPLFTISEEFGASGSPRDATPEGAGRVRTMNKTSSLDQQKKDAGIPVVLVTDTGEQPEKPLRSGIATDVEKDRDAFVANQSRDTSAPVFIDPCRSSSDSDSDTKTTTVETREMQQEEHRSGRQDIVKSSAVDCESKQGEVGLHMRQSDSIKSDSNQEYSKQNEATQENTTQQSSSDENTDISRQPT